MEANTIINKSLKFTIKFVSSFHSVTSKQAKAFGEKTTYFRTAAFLD